MDNGLVQVITNHIGNAQGSLAQRWSAQLKKHVKIEQPLVVEEYNMHMGGVDLCDMLMSVYRIHLRSTKYYMHIFYYCITLAVVNSWLLYRRHCLQRNVSTKSQTKLLQFQSTIATALLMVGKEQKQQRGNHLLLLLPRRKPRVMLRQPQSMMSE
jgi:hypothetical protein